MNFDGMTIWEILEISETDDEHIIRKAYSKVVKQYHPEENPELFKKVYKAYKIAISIAKHKRLWNAQSHDDSMFEGQVEDEFSPLPNQAVSEMTVVETVETNNIESAIPFEEMDINSEQLSLIDAVYPMVFQLRSLLEDYREDEADVIITKLANRNAFDDEGIVNAIIDQILNIELYIRYDSVPVKAIQRIADMISVSNVIDSVTFDAFLMHIRKLSILNQISNFTFMRTKEEIHGENIEIPFETKKILSEIDDFNDVIHWIEKEELDILKRPHLRNDVTVFLYLMLHMYEDRPEYKHIVQMRNALLIKAYQEDKFENLDVPSKVWIIMCIILIGFLVLVLFGIGLATM
ncbi:J domain-containing protein [Erysipelothrix sp. HDW6C]|uniref:J domain-containing protein n=1 Tax=Erysipelothrix sp. HDW6C TaxID=2714930 RepID=UPI00140BCFC5|nr:J domain-containing protein [Erysipelothrix sp. HDW6C]QIK69395.1 J domain-containing protein [Erysipelothrix sp. HDW6C]